MSMPTAGQMLGTFEVQVEGETFQVKESARPTLMSVLRRNSFHEPAEVKEEAGPVSGGPKTPPRHPSEPVKAREEEEAREEEDEGTDVSPRVSAKDLIG